MVGKKQIVFSSDDIEDFIILKSDEYPTYHLANVVDDHAMEISHVIRGDEWISSTPKHILLYEAFGWQHPAFVHLPVILGPDHQKLSKRHGAKSALDYKREGYLKEALLNYMSLLGWNPGGDKEIMSMDEIIELFDLKDINTASSVFDSKKLEWMNGVYIRESQISNLKSQILAINPQVASIGDDTLDKVIPLAQTRMKTLGEFQDLIKPFLEEPKISLGEKEAVIVKELLTGFSSLPAWDGENILSIVKTIMERQQVKMPIFYTIFTGEKQGLPLSDVLEILGKDEVLKRLKNLS